MTPGKVPSQYRRTRRTAERISGAGSGVTLTSSGNSAEQMTADLPNLTAPAFLPVGSNGKLRVAGSSARFKEAIKPMDKASEAILALKPVTFRYKHELDPDGISQFGLIAEHVEKINPDLVVRDNDGKVMTVRYEGGQCDDTQRVSESTSQS